MTTINTQRFLEETHKVVNKYQETQMENMRKASEILAESIMNDGVVHFFGSGHSVGVGMEMIGRPGNLVPIHQIVTSDFVTKGITTLEDFRDPVNKFERRPGVADKLFDMYNIKPQDAFVIISNSGINGVVIDLAIKAKQEKHPVIVITSLEHTTAEPSRHPSGQKLMDFGDIVIDNCGPRGDAMIPLEDGGKIGSISSIIGILIAQGFTAEVTSILKDNNYEVPVLLFEDNAEAKEHNQALRAKYEGRI